MWTGQENFDSFMLGPFKLKMTEYSFNYALIWEANWTMPEAIKVFVFN